jgi:hypothetical protein
MRDPEETRYKKKATKKRFGIESWSSFSKDWSHYKWYETEKARDQALEVAKRHFANYKFKNYTFKFRAINR